MFRTRDATFSADGSSYATSEEVQIHQDPTTGQFISPQKDTRTVDREHGRVVAGTASQAQEPATLKLECQEIRRSLTKMSATVHGQKWDDLAFLGFDI